MTSYYTLSSAQLDYAQCGTNRYHLYVAFHDPVNVTVASRGILTDGDQPVLPIAADTLYLKRAPYIPTVNFGSNRIGFVGEPLFFDGTRSTQRNSILAWGHQWSASGPATIKTYSIPVPFGDVLKVTPNQIGNQQCSITWTAPGNYYVILTCQDRYGNQSQGVRQVRIYQDRDHSLPGVTQISNVQGGMDSGGYQLSMTTLSANLGILQPDALPLGAYLPITVMAETIYDLDGKTQNVTLGPYGTFAPGQPYNDPRILFAGYVDTATCHQDDQYDTLSFTCKTPHSVVQEANVLTIGYYNAKWATKDAQGRWATLTPTIDNSDHLVADLTAEDIYRNMLTDHCTIGLYHDVFCWHDWAPDPNDVTGVAQKTYSSLTVNQGTVWDGITAIVQNEFGSIWCERDGSICVGPSINFRGSASWNWLANPTTVGSIIGIVNHQGPTQGRWPPDPTRPAANLAVSTAFPPDIGVTTQPVIVSSNILPVNVWKVYNLRHELYPSYVPAAGSGLTAYATQNTKPAKIDWVPMLNQLWGNQAIAQPITLTGGNERNPAQAVILPIAAHFSDVSEEDSGDDIAIIPETIDVDEAYTSRSALVKLIGYKVQSDSAWSAFYPTDTFDAKGTMRYRLPTGAFTLFDQLVLADLTEKSASPMAWSYLWQLARLSFADSNKRYTTTITVGMCNYLNLHDLIYVTRQRPTKGPAFTKKLFYVDSISYALDLDANNWRTTIIGYEVTSQSFTSPVVPPYGPPSA